ncbi:MAG: ATP-binding protein [Cyclobacteriaceae bacterium]|nr:ATP-binding protein [Cyclobacteriaceae bacterium]MCH8517772.1 ATP-binding protein [Cyclobacteriaceae bacterium]
MNNKEKQRYILDHTSPEEVDLSFIAQLAEWGEGEKIEFKRKVNHPEKIINEIVALANAKGGWLVIGVNDDGHLSACKYAQEEAFALEAKINAHIRPVVDMRRVYVPLSGTKQFVVYRIYESKHKPHYILEKRLTKNKKMLQIKTGYYRVEDKTVKASRELWLIMQARSRNADFQLSYGEEEAKVMQLFRKKEEISLEEVVIQSGLSKRLASDTLVRLVLGNVLRILPGEGKDRYRAVESGLSAD